MENQHVNCRFSFACGDKQPACTHRETASFRFLRLKAGEKQNDIELKGSTIIFLFDGEMLVSGEKLCAGEMILVASNQKTCIEATKGTSALVTTYNYKFRYCDGGLPRIPQGIVGETHYPLVMHGRIRESVALMVRMMEDGVDCPGISHAKAKELLILIRAYYGINQRAAFFSPAIRGGRGFAQQVLKYHSEVRTVKELAGKMNYSLAAFHAHFEKHFPMPAYRWMQRQRAGQVLEDLEDDERSIKDIAVSNRFSTLSRFYDFCRKSFGTTPLEVRKKLKDCEKIDILL